MNSQWLISCVYLCQPVTGSSSCLFTSLRPITVPHDFSHKTSNCQCISQHQEIEGRLQVSVTDSVERVIGSRRMKLRPQFLFINTPFHYVNKNSSFHNMSYDVIYNFKNGFLFLTKIARWIVLTTQSSNFLIFVVLSIMLYSSEISPTRCNICVFILRNGFTLHVSGDNLTHHQEYICCIWPQLSRLT